MESSRHGLILSGLICLLLGLAPVVSAQEPAAIHAGPFDITPTLGISYEKDDNFFESATDTQDVSTAIITSGLEAEADNGVTQYTLRYRFEDGRRSDLNDAFDYTDQEFGAGINWRANVRNRVELGWLLSEGHDDPSNDNSEQQNEFDETDLSFRYTFGADGARGRIILSVTQTDLEYTNNRVATATVLNPTTVLDNEQLTTDLSFLVGFGGDSRLVFQVINDDVEFDESSQQRDRQDLSYLVGFEWGITDQTQGSIRLGRTENDLTQQDQQSTESTWEVNVNWLPREQTAFNFTASRNTESGDDAIGNFTTVSSFGASWAHRWNSRLRSELSYTTTEDDFQGAGGRVDDTDSIALSINYIIRRWLSIELALETRERDSTINPNDNEFEQDTARLTFNLNL